MFYVSFDVIDHNNITTLNTHTVHCRIVSVISHMFVISLHILKHKQYISRAYHNWHHRFATLSIPSLFLSLSLSLSLSPFQSLPLSLCPLCRPLHQGNNISQIKTDQFPPGLTRLNVNRNQLSYIDGSAFELVDLTRLTLSYNKLQSLDTINFPSSLTYLEAEYNNITSISGLRFTDPTSNNLDTLDLYHNPISIVSTDAFQNLTQLTKLFLSSTALTRLPLALTSLTTLESVDLRGVAQLTCSCTESALAAWFGHRTQELKRGGKTFTLRGDCSGGTKISYFLEKLAPQCPS